jgi:2-polyprenyl-6-methoxyphenol hydroxylase-like FAD-dependent oxidoreductase
VRVVVVGAGPAGVATALLLARYGVEVVLVEREAMPGRLFRGEGLFPLGIDALHEMGVGRVLDEVPSRTIGSWDTWIDGERVLVVAEPVAQLGRRAVRVVSQPALLARLLDRATGYPGFAFRPQARLAELLRDGRRRVVGARLVPTGGGAAGWDERADLVLGCDGRGSSVRRHAGLALARSAEDYDVVWFTAPAPQGLAYRSGFLLCVRAGAHPAVGYVSWDGRLQYGVVMPKGRPWEPGTGDWLADAVRAAPAFLAAHLLACRGEIEGPMRLTVLVGRCPAWTAPGVLLLGDAAHPMSPVRAQGINLALRDAVVAANHLVPALTGQVGVDAVDAADVVDAACRAVQAEREPEIERAQRLQRRESRGQGHARSGSWRYTLARHGARLLGGHRWAETAWLHRQHDLRFGSRPVRLRLPPPP